MSDTWRHSHLRSVTQVQLNSRRWGGFTWDIACSVTLMRKLLTAIVVRPCQHSWPLCCKGKWSKFCSVDPSLLSVTYPISSARGTGWLTFLWKEPFYQLIRVQVGFWLARVVVILDSDECTFVLQVEPSSGIRVSLPDSRSLYATLIFPSWDLFTVKSGVSKKITNNLDCFSLSLSLPPFYMSNQFPQESCEPIVARVGVRSSLPKCSTCS